MKLLSRIHSGYLLLFSFLVFFVLTPLFQKGVFGDGLMYLTVGLNRYKEHGSFWKQYYSETSMSFFCEQPPLYFESLSWFYKLFGGAEVAEKFFTLTLLALTVFLTIKIWNKMTQDKNKAMSWLPVLFLFCVPVFTWSFCNQVIETMVVPFSLLAFYFLLGAIGSMGVKRMLYFAACFFTIFILFLTKGIQSTFILAAPFLASVTVMKQHPGKALAQAALGIIVFATIFLFVFLLSEDALYWLTSYFDKRIVATFKDTGATATRHVDIAIRFFSELLPVLGLVAVVSLFLALGKKYPLRLQLKNFSANKRAHWLVLISLSASLPLAVTLEQRGFYLSPAFPFAVLALCLYHRKYLWVIIGRSALKHRRPWVLVGSIAMISSLVFFFLEKDGYKRDEGMIKDVGEMKKLFAPGEIIGINGSTWNTFSLHSYLNMANDNSLYVTDTARYFIREKENKESIPGHYKRLNIETYAVDIYRRRIDPVK